PYFDTYIYVIKAAGGPWGQHLFLFRKQADGTLGFEQSFAVSTGREQAEQYFTATPTGLFEFDVHRFMPTARSAKWNDAAMPWAMFLNYAYRTQMSGVALHAAVGRHELADIGRRASGGCVRLPLEKADLLFHRFLKEERGRVPVFAFDPVRGTTNTDGAAAQDGEGNILLADGLRVLLIIENYQGEAAAGSQS
ncbi:MAG TPA: L,D-transpeptidase, partial [Rhizomicrobium sp.]